MLLALASSTLAVLNLDAANADLLKVFGLCVLIVAIVAVVAIVRGHLKGAIVMVIGVVVALGLLGLSSNYQSVGNSVGDFIRSSFGG